MKYWNLEFRKQWQKFSGFTAQIIQHETGHCVGILI
ncbi:peptide deformylase [Selenomonas sp. KH1T6]